MGGNEEIVIRVCADGRRYCWWTRSAGAQLIPDQATVNITTSAATLATAVQNALPTLES